VTFEGELHHSLLYPLSGKVEARIQVNPLPPPQMPHFYLTHRVSKVVWQKPIPAQIRQLNLHITNNEGQVDGSVWDLTFAKRLYKDFM
jgi:hypothetical protein